MVSVPANTRKRKSPEAFRFDDLNQDLLERVLSRLPASSFFRLRAVCNRWSSIASSATFRLACSEVPSRDPWFLMAGGGQELDRRSTVFDSSEGNWKLLDRPGFLQQDRYAESIPVASSGGLVCFRTPSGHLIVCNPVTGACREILRPSQLDQSQPLHAIAMSSSNRRPSYRIVLVFGELSSLKALVFDSEKNHWEEEVTLRKASGSSPEPDNTVYFLSKAGDVVVSDVQRSPTKQYSSVLTAEGVVYFLGHSGTVVACDLALGTFVEWPRLLPVFFEYSIDVVECRGEVLVVVLSEILETASLGIWRFSEGGRSWQRVAAMPPAMSHEFYGKKADINCVGCGDSVMVCISSSELSSCVMCNLLENEWVELPKCFLNGRSKEFTSAFSFEPRVEACV